MQNRVLAQTIVDRMNEMLEHKGAHKIVGEMCQHRFPADELVGHPTIQLKTHLVDTVPGDGVPPRKEVHEVGLLGILNGLAGEPLIVADYVESVDHSELTLYLEGFRVVKETP